MTKSVLYTLALMSRDMLLLCFFYRGNIESLVATLLVDNFSTCLQNNGVHYTQYTIRP